MNFIDLHEDIQIYLQNPQLLHYDADYVIPDFNKANYQRHCDVAGYKKVGTKMVVAAVFPYDILGVSGNRKIVPQSKAKITAQIAWYKNLTKTYKDFYLITSRSDFETAQKQNKIGLSIHMEGLGELNSVQDIVELKSLGVSSVGLSWNNPNELCSTCAENSNDVGLKPRGKEIVEAIIKSDLVLDLTHSSLKTQDSVLANYSYPKIMMSHCGVMDRYNFEQNVRSEVLQELAKRGGVAGLSFLYLMLAKKGMATIDEFLKHIDSAKNYLSVLAIGTDFFGFNFGEGLKEISSIHNLTLLYDALSDYFDQKTADAVFYKNAQSFIERIFPT